MLLLLTHRKPPNEIIKPTMGGKCQAHGSPIDAPKKCSRWSARAGMNLFPCASTVGVRPRPTRASRNPDGQRRSTVNGQRYSNTCLRCNGTGGNLSAFPQVGDRGKISLPSLKPSKRAHLLWGKAYDGLRYGSCGQERWETDHLPRPLDRFYDCPPPFFRLRYGRWCLPKILRCIIFNRRNFPFVFWVGYGGHTFKAGGIEAVVMTAIALLIDPNLVNTALETSSLYPFWPLVVISNTRSINPISVLDVTLGTA